MDERACGLALRLYPLTETSLIIHWLTSESGRLTTVAKGARRPSSPFRGKLDLFYLADFTFTRNRRSDLHTLREIGLIETHSALRKELGYLQQAAYCAALIELTTEKETPLPGIFELLTGLLQHLQSQPPQPQSIFAFELKLLKELGLKPDLANSKLNAGTKQMMVALAASDWPSLARLKPSGAQVTELRQFLHGFLIYHLGKIPKGRSAALDSLEPVGSRKPAKPLSF